MSERVRVCTLAEIPSGTAKLVLHGKHKICLVRLGDLQPVPAEAVSRLYTADRNYLLVEIRRATLGDLLKRLKTDAAEEDRALSQAVGRASDANAPAEIEEARALGIETITALGDIRPFLTGGLAGLLAAAGLVEAAAAEATRASPPCGPRTIAP